MMDVVREKVTLEIGARGLRSLFSSKPSDKDVARVKRYGSLAVRVLRAVLAADGPLDAEERPHDRRASSRRSACPRPTPTRCTPRPPIARRRARRLRRDRPRRRARDRARRVARGRVGRDRPARGAGRSASSAARWASRREDIEDARRARGRLRRRAAQGGRRRGRRRALRAERPLPRARACSSRRSPGRSCSRGAGATRRSRRSGRARR